MSPAVCACYDRRATSDASSYCVNRKIVRTSKCLKVFYFFQFQADDGEDVMLLEEEEELEMLPDEE